jgi:hypothetical protein
MEKLYSMAEATNILTGILKVTAQEVRRKIRMGDIAGRKVGSKWFVSDDTLYAIVSQANKKKV